jgi:hypothetical protein
VGNVVCFRIQAVGFTTTYVLCYSYIIVHTFAQFQNPDTASVINIVAKGFNICLTKYSVTKTVTTRVRVLCPEADVWSKVKEGIRAT